MRQSVLVIKKRWRDKNKEHMKKYSKEYRSKNKDKILAYNIQYKKTNKGRVALASYKYNIKVRYNITLEDYVSVFNKQKGCCAICGRSQKSVTRRLAVDHNHKTGSFRGILCFSCNAHIAWLENRKIKILKYLEEN